MRKSTEAGWKAYFKKSVFHGFILFFINQACKPKKENEPQINNPKIEVQIPDNLKPYYKVPEKNPTTREGVALGKVLFFDKQLSVNNTISCASCHRPEKAFADFTPVSMGIFGRMGIRNTPSIWNAGLLSRLFWDGRDTSLEQQALHPIQDENEMGMNLNALVNKLSSDPKYPAMFLKAFGNREITVDKIAKALAQFERSLVSFNSKYDRFLMNKDTLSPLEKRGMDLFFTHPDPFVIPKGKRGGNCGDCHLPQTLLGRQDELFGFFNTGLSMPGSGDAGLQSLTGIASDFGKFKVPGLRNVALTPPYMHDGRFQTLEQVLDHYNAEDLFSRPNVDPQIQAAVNQKFGTSLGLRDDEKEAIISFLKTLTDSSALQFQP
jgi:cytochrome c peroxidase